MIVTDSPAEPLPGLIAVIFGMTVKLIALPATPPTVVTIGPDVAPAGTGTTILVSLQFVGVAAVPLNVIVLEP